MKIVSVKFRNSGSDNYNSREYYYKSYFDVQVGDLVVVDTSTNGFQIAMVWCADVVELESCSKATKYLVQKVDTSAYYQILARESQKAQLKKEMDARIQKYQQMAVYELVASKDPELAEILAKYKDLLEE